MVRTGANVTQTASEPVLSTQKTRQTSEECMLQHAQPLSLYAWDKKQGIPNSGSSGPSVCTSGIVMP